MKIGVDTTGFEEQVGTVEQAKEKEIQKLMVKFNCSREEAIRISRRV